MCMCVCVCVRACVRACWGGGGSISLGSTVGLIYVYTFTVYRLKSGVCLCGDGWGGR